MILILHNNFTAMQRDASTVQHWKSTTKNDKTIALFDFLTD